MRDNPSRAEWHIEFRPVLAHDDPAALLVCHVRIVGHTGTMRRNEKVTGGMVDAEIKRLQDEIGRLRAHPVAKDLRAAAMFISGRALREIGAAEGYGDAEKALAAVKRGVAAAQVAVGNDGDAAERLMRAIQVIRRHAQPPPENATPGA